MDMLAVLEGMAQIGSSPAVYAVVGRWMRLFGYTAAQAERVIKVHFEDLSRVVISDEQWALMRNTVEAQGHDQENYAHCLTRFATISPGRQQPRTATSTVKKKNKAQEYLVYLEGSLTAAEI
ncbi:hypothetical protein BU23DRAFT_566790 [Bimuria novae-zelandiae CBS 107.79]|uniref:Uncharacterized protein n=1 Tax=Bimuria novae-zelandiae CBS 107.79 TaxID=1447943 RepID=A0A6A5VEH3_9PLEO|nr:hypothetical protein BU23DRAFT_566790 [Bimuria novae-zelandiae CBS 107.79]